MREGGPKLAEICIKLTKLRHAASLHANSRFNYRKSLRVFAIASHRLFCEPPALLRATESRFIIHQSTTLPEWRKILMDSVGSDPEAVETYSEW